MIPIRPRGPHSTRGSYILVLIFGLLFVISVWSILNPEPTAVDEPEVERAANGPSYGEYLLRLVLVGGALVVVLIVVARVIKRKTSHSANQTLDMHILGKRYLNPKQYFMKVMIEDRFLLLGVTDQNISLITELPDPGEDVIEDIKKQSEQPTFGSILDHAGLGRKGSR